MTDDDVRFNVKMPRQLREDAKRNTDRGELSEAVREVFQQKAYGVDATGQPTELEQTKAKLRDVRKRIDDKRHERERIGTEIEALETRATRLEERVDALQDERSELDGALNVLENMLHDGDRMWPVRIKNAVDVDHGTAEELYHELQDNNADLPECAFEEPTVEEPTDWRKAAKIQG
jgi:chromosome segregation ATPase